MRAPRPTVGLAVAVVAWAAACGSSPNGPPDPVAARDGGADALADAPRDGDPPSPEAGLGLGCPASFSDGDGTPCFSILPPCDYPEGRCGCLGCLVPGGLGFAWACRPWDSGGFGCPARAPDMGSPCDGEGLVCRYAGYCSVSVGDDLTCQSGTWQPAPPLDPCGLRSCPF
jgi:hypothetical protein